MVETAVGMTLAEAHVRGYALAHRHGVRFADYVRGLDGNSVARPVPGTAWTVGETVTHVESVVLRYTQDLRRADSAAGVSTQNAEDITRLGVDVARAAETIVEQLELLGPIVEHIEPERLFPFHAGEQTTLAGGWGNLIGELLAHGDDLARATGVAFGVPSADTEVLWRFTAPLLQGWLVPAAAATHETWLLRFPFGPIVVAFDDGRLLWDTALPAQPDHVIDIDDAAEFALQVPYRRRPPATAEIAIFAGRFADL